MPAVVSRRGDVDVCAREILDVVPLGVRWLRAAVRRRQPSWSLPQLHTLDFLQRHPGTSLSDLSGHLGVGLPTASTLVTRLVSVGQVDRHDDPSERRKAVLTLTVEGEVQLADAIAASGDELTRRLRSLRPSELRQLMDALPLLRRLFAEP